MTQREKQNWACAVMRRTQSTIHCAASLDPQQQRGGTVLSEHGFNFKTKPSHVEQLDAVLARVLLPRLRVVEVDLPGQQRVRKRAAGTVKRERAAQVPTCREQSTVLERRDISDLCSTLWCTRERGTPGIYLHRYKEYSVTCSVMYSDTETA